VYTGIVEERGDVVESRPVGTQRRLRIRGRTVTSDARLGDSLSVDGCCLTVAALAPGEWFEADVVAETLATTTLGRLRSGSSVNLERSLRVDGRLGGHLVQGHVDGVGEVVEVTDDERGRRLRAALDADLARYVARKGSIAVDGVSLTVVDVHDPPDPPDPADPAWASGGAHARRATFSVALIPTTLAVTNLGERRVGDAVNLEVDLLARHLERLQTAQAAQVTPAASSAIATHMTAGLATGRPA